MIPTPFEIVRQLVDRADPVIFDVGANIGNTVEVYRTLFEQCVIHAFEPDSRMFAALQSRLGGLDRVILNRAAVGETAGTAVLHRTTHAESGSLLALNSDSWWGKALDIRPAGTETVPVETIDRYCAAQGVAEIDFLKLDVQGFEPECLRGAGAMLGAGRIRVIQAELVYHGLYERTTRFIDLESLLDPFGYRLFTIHDIRIGDDTGELLSLDTVFTRVRSPG
ncbi:MAG TPA: FkbM family methyltransferase [Candidatus Sulfotelmatobacter sp.]|nr:FkbM family methyltransferase [Candidatus Sulfotelmatobacter sp.]